jgi:hypothetical protein
MLGNEVTGADRVLEGIVAGWLEECELGGREVVHSLDSAPEETIALDGMAEDRLLADEAWLVIGTLEEILTLDPPGEETPTLDTTAEDGFPEEEKWFVTGTVEGVFEEGGILEICPLECAEEDARIEVTGMLDGWTLETREAEEIQLVAKVVGGRLLGMLVPIADLELIPCDDTWEILKMATEEP